MKVTAGAGLPSRRHTRLLRRRAGPLVRYDIVFYTPWIGSILSGSGLPPGGAERQILLLAQALVKRGVRPAIIVYGASNLPPILDGVTILQRPPYRHRGSFITKVVETAAIWRALWNAPSETIVYRGVGLELGLIALYARLARRRLLFSSANVVDFDCRKLLPKRRDATMYEFGVRLASAIVVQTEEQVVLCERAFGRRPIMIKSIASLAERQNTQPEAFLWVGRLAMYKRPLDYIALARAIPEARFWMVGVPTPSQKEDEHLIDEIRASAQGIPNLELLPPRPHAEIEALMSRAVASVNTADFEGMPNVLLEGWSRGVPALVLNHDPGGVVTDHGLGGFSNGSMKSFIALAREMWASRNGRDELSERCQSYIAKHHSPDAAATRWAQLLTDPGKPSGVAHATSDADRICAE